jgi:hypothetical protein
MRRDQVPAPAEELIARFKQLRDGAATNRSRASDAGFCATEPMLQQDVPAEH